MRYLTACWLPAAGLALLLSSEAGAMSLIYDGNRDAELRACDQHRYQGQGFDAQQCYSRILQRNPEPAIRAEAAWALEDVKSANQLFREAIAAAPDNPAIKVRWGQLFRHTHQDNDAMGLFQESLQLDPEHIGAKLGIAAILAERYDGRAEELTQEILSKDSNQLDALLLTARMQLEKNEIGSANLSLDLFLEQAEQQGFPLLEGWALKAAAQMLEDKLTPEQFAATDWVQRALDYNPAYGEIFETVAHFYIITYRYRETVAVLNHAVQLQPSLWTAHAELGINLLRIDRIDEARRHLQIAYAGDPYSVQTVNTLRLVDSLDEFEVTEHQFRYAAGQNAEGNQAFHIADIKLKLHRSEASALRPYVLKLTQDAIRIFSERYRFLPEEPIVVELFPNHDDFAVRTVSVPGVGLLGVTFGYLLAMDSPSAKPEGQYHWGETLWHELAHVFTLEASHHRVPRWFSEGSAVFEQWRTGPVPGVKVPTSVWEKIAEGNMLPVTELDQGFVRPQYENQVMVSYMQAGLVCEYIQARWSFDHLVQILEQYRDGFDTGQAIQKVLAIDARQFDRDFADFIDERFGYLLSQLKEWQQLQQLGQEAAKAENYRLALQYAQQAIAIYPDYTEGDSPYLLAVSAAKKLEQPDQALTILEQYFAAGGRAPQALRDLAAGLTDAGQTEGAVAVLESLHYAAPLDAGLHARLGQLYLGQQRGREAVSEYQVLLALDPHNLADAHYGLARAYQLLDETAQTRRHLLMALEAAPHFREAQQLLLKITTGANGS